MAAQPGTLRPGGRTARVRESVLAAVLATLAETDYHDLTVEQVAQRAGVAKTTVYRRWGNVDGLILDLMRDQSARRVPAPDTGDLDQDMRALARGIVEIYRDPAVKAMITSMVAAAVHLPEARRTLSEFFITRITEMGIIAERAVRRGELPAGTDTVEVIRMMSAPFYHRMFITGEPVDEAVADRSAAAAVAAARAGVLVHDG
jgi:AcrR family transcriptional regulator